MLQGVRLVQKQSQSLALTPQLLASIRLLQFGHHELKDFIDSQIEQNPLLEKAADGSERAHAHDDFEEMAVDPGDAFDEVSGSAISVRPDTAPGHAESDQGRTEEWRREVSGTTQGANGDFDWEDFVAAPVTLHHHIAEQLALAFKKPGDRLIAASLADHLDEAGYLLVDLKTLELDLNTPAEVLAGILATMQTFDPPGIFARNLAECLGIQLRARNRLDPAMARLLENLELLARRDFRQLQRCCGVDEEDLLDMLAEIRTLDPRPGAAFETRPVAAVAPDVLVTAGRNDQWQIEMNPETLPRLLVNRDYFIEISRTVRTAAEKAFVDTCMRDGTWLIRSLDQRARTILKVTAEIVRQQDGFLKNGVDGLRPLSLKAVADAIGMHESTVSRVTMDKSIMTPRGLFAMRYFFSVAIAATVGQESRSAETIRHRIAEMVAAEEAARILSDDAMVEQLKAEGVLIARRTIAKYRESLGIASSVQRRREKQALDRAMAV